MYNIPVHLYLRSNLTAGGARLPFLSAWFSSFERLDVVVERFVCLNLSDYCFGMMYNLPVHLYLRSNLTAGGAGLHFYPLGFLLSRDWM